MKVEVWNLKKGKVLEIDESLYKILDISHTHTWRGSATYSLKLKNLVTWTTNNFTYKSGTVLEEVEVNTKKATYLYNDWDNYYFMEEDTSEIYPIPKEDIEDVVLYLKEDLDLFLMIYGEKILWIILPSTVNYKIKETQPWIKGNRVTWGKKPATLETGLQIVVPLHYEEWDEVKVNTDDGKIS